MKTFWKGSECFQGLERSDFNTWFSWSCLFLDSITGITGTEKEETEAKRETHRGPTKYRACQTSSRHVFMGNKEELQKGFSRDGK